MIHYMVEGEETYSPSTDQAKKIKKLELENKKLKECLEMFVSHMTMIPADWITNHEKNMLYRAQKCLKELEVRI